jgi:catechol 2,3-dioxygenase-like lactoylglutathione lyase family enzyme
MPRLFRILLPVTDIEKAAPFYEKVLNLTGQRVSPGRHYFNCEGTILACFDPTADGDQEDARPSTEPVYIAVDDIELTFRLCKDAGAAFADTVDPDAGPLGEIAARPWGERSFYAADPFGNRLCFVSRETMFMG